MSNISFNDIFSPMSADDVLITKEKSTKVDFYKPTPPPNGVYSAAIRFIRNPQDKSKSVIEKWRAYMENPANGQKRYVDCPSSIGQESIIQKTWAKLFYSKNQADKNLASAFSRRQQFYSIIQIIDDPQHPEMNGKLMPFQYGIKIYNKIQKALKPEGKYEQKKEVFDLFDGYIFNLKVKIVSDYNNYDDSEFGNIAVPIHVDGKAMEKTEQDFEKIVQFLKTDAPDMSIFEFKPWGQDTTDFVNDVIRNTIPGETGRALSQVQSRTNTSNTTVRSSVNNFDSELVNIINVKSNPSVSTVASTSATSDASISEDELMSLLDN
jgi:hypothetical protein